MVCVVKFLFYMSITTHLRKCFQMQAKLDVAYEWLRAAKSTHFYKSSLNATEVQRIKEVARTKIFQAAAIVERMRGLSLKDPERLRLGREIKKLDSLLKKTARFLNQLKIAKDSL